MENQVIRNLRAWASKRPSHRRSPFVVACLEEWQKPGKVHQYLPVEARQLQERDEQAIAIEKEWDPQIDPPRGQAPMARCRVVAFRGEEAECTVFMGGYEIPRVAFPAWVLKQKGLDVGSRFIWIMRDGAHVCPADIDPDVPQNDELTDQEKAELDRLYEAFERRRAKDGGNWSVYSRDEE